MADELVLLMDFDLFQEWVLRGVKCITLGTETMISNFHRNTHVDSKVELLIALPNKYKRIVKQQKQIYLLVDEIIKISSSSEEQTLKLKFILQNLRESWLPFEYQSNWIDKAFILEVSMPCQLTQENVVGATQLSDENASIDGQAITKPHKKISKQPKKRRKAIQHMSEVPQSDPIKSEKDKVAKKQQIELPLSDSRDKNVQRKNQEISND